MFKKLGLVVMGLLPITTICTTVLASEAYLSINLNGKVIPKNASSEAIIDVSVPLAVDFVLDSNSGEIISPKIPIENNGNVDVKVESLGTSAKSIYKGTTTSMTLVGRDRFSNWRELSESQSQKYIALYLKALDRKWAEGSPILNGEMQLKPSQQELGILETYGRSFLTVDGEFGQGWKTDAVIKAKLTLKVSHAK